MRLFGRPSTPPGGAARFPRRPAALLATDAWRPLAQLADQRIRAHRADRLDVGGLIATVSGEIEAVLVDEPAELLAAAWAAWDAEMRRLEGVPPAPTPERDGLEDVAQAPAVRADVAALVPQLVASRLSENVR